ncbi:bifunctional biotin--[acetyl-CoA-carboxylase] ligase/biotin operon repressor BirA [Aliikangiella sp. IMCC44359]|uniref:bifunctional biotin--[acetyl-CoA-carboxylase] ligase/biotin operon repressor BirA n=1 Tax=Aliikangiella sp. IMCC44359 TaxID=3459125 RepID=UPI00403ABB14
MTNKTILRIEALLRCLADGRFHSGESLAEQLEVSRTAVWKLIQKIISWQVNIYSVRGKGYKIPGGLKLLDAEFLSGALVNNHHFTQVDVLTSIDSTADYIARKWKQEPFKGRVCIAEHQTAGRGRKGRPWVSPFGANLYFSIAVQLPLGLSALGGISLAVGISLAKTLNHLTTEPVKIKWPNDLLLNNQKLAGILVEAIGDSNDSSFLNIGVGINWDMQLNQGQSIDQPWANLCDIVSKQLTRSEVLAKLLVGIDKTLTLYQASGFTPFVSSWQSLSALYMQPVTIFTPQGKVEGKEVGIENNGALRLETIDGIQIFHSGEVSLRKRRIDR